MTTEQISEKDRQQADAAFNLLRMAGRLELIPSIFKDAADHIERHGWWRTGLTCRLDKSSGNYSECAFSAARQVHGKVVYKFGLPREERAAMAAVLDFLMVEHFGVSDMAGIFRLNDSHEDRDEGKAWAIANLREIAESCVGRQEV